MNNLSQLEENLRRLRERIQSIESPPNNLPRSRDKVKGKVRLRWNHKQSVNLTSYRIDKIHRESLKESICEPNPIILSAEILRMKHYRI